VSGDLAGRRGQIVETELRGIVRIITADVPLVEMFGYTTILRGLTQGRASNTMEPSEYRQMPDRLRDEVLARA
jgi:elongation factor G